MGVGLLLKTIDKLKTLCEVGEVGVVQQVGKLAKNSSKRGSRGTNQRTRNLSWSNPHPRLRKTA